MPQQPLSLDLVPQAPSLSVRDSDPVYASVMRKKAPARKARPMTQGEYLNQTRPDETATPGSRLDAMYSALDRGGMDVAPLQTADKYLLGIGSGSQAVHRLLQGRGNGWDLLDAATAAPTAGPIGELASLAVMPALTAAARYAPEAVRSLPGRLADWAKATPGGPLSALDRSQPLSSTVNIGLAPSSRMGGAPLTQDDVLAALRQAGHEPSNVRVVPSDTEPTVVADIHPRLDRGTGRMLSSDLGQEAIVQHYGGGQGALYGPMANSWGPFNSEYFRTQGGDRLANEMAGRTPVADLNAAFARGASAQDLITLAAAHGIDADPASLAIHTRLRDAGATPQGLGAFVDAPYGYDPEALARYQVAARQMQERGIAASKGLGDVLSALPSEQDLGAQMASTRLSPIGQVPERQAVDARGVHISRVPGLTQTDPSFYGTGHRGTEYATSKDIPRTYFYSGPEGTVQPEESVMRGGDRYAYTAPLSNLYDVNSDPEKLVSLLRAYHQPDYQPTLPFYAHQGTGLEGTSPLRDMEQMLQAKGYSGYISDFGPSWDPSSRRAAAVFNPVDVSPTDLQEKYAVGGRVNAFAVGR